MNNVIVLFFLGFTLFSPTSDILVLDDLEVCIIGSECETVVTLPSPDPVGCSVGYTLEVTTDLPNPTGDQLVYEAVPPGTYSVTYTQTDTCGTQFTDSFQVEVVDCMAPYPYCKNGLVFEYPVNQWIIELAADIMDAGSYDNCGGPVDFSFSPDPADTLRTFLCPDDLGAIVLQLWVTDESGNQDYCEIVIYFQAGISCDVFPDLSISNEVVTENEEGISDVIITHQYYAGGTITEEECTTDVNGICSVFQSGLWGLDDVAVIPEKDVDYDNGVTTLDMLLMVKHILGVELLDSPYKIIAGDVNNDGMLSTTDLIQIQLTILGLGNGFPNNTSWRFIDADYVFPDPLDPWSGGPFPEIKAYASPNLPADLFPKFIGLKVGDVNGSANPN